MHGGRTYEDFEVGERFESDGRTVTEADIRLFTGATGSIHPAHLDHEYCADHPLLDGVAAHGTMTLAVADGFLAPLVTRPAALAVNYGHRDVKYRAPVYPDDTLSATFEIVEKNRLSDEWGSLTLDVDLSNQDDETVLTEVHVVNLATADNEHVET